MTVIERQLLWVKSQALPVVFSGKENWLGFKPTPHTPMLFINKVTADGVETNSGKFLWAECSNEIIATVYQRMKGMEAGLV